MPEVRAMSLRSLQVGAAYSLEPQVLEESQLLEEPLEQHASVLELAWSESARMSF